MTPDEGLYALFRASAASADLRRGGHGGNQHISGYLHADEILEGTWIGAIMP